MLEEEIVVEKRLVLKEEIHINGRRTRKRITKVVELDREHSTIERLDRTGQVIGVSRPSRPEPPSARVGASFK